VRLEPEKEYDNMTESAVDKEIIRKEKIDELHKAIDKLKYEQRVALTLHCFEDLSYKEIASIMNASLPKVESLIFRAKNNLKKMLIEQNS
jgi:RNA polymerase sigma-70 factor (ECF subfamily)